MSMRGEDEDDDLAWAKVSVSTANGTSSNDVSNNNAITGMAPSMLLFLKLPEFCRMGSIST